MERCTSAVRRFETAEWMFKGPSEGNPYLTQWVEAVAAGEGEMKHLHGFYDGDGVYRLRFLPSCEGEYELEGRTSWGETFKERFRVLPAAEGRHGLVRVAQQFHFAFEDGTPYYPVGTTCYVWEHQREQLRLQTLLSLKEAGFNKLRFCIFPKHYVYNFREPEEYPYALKADSPWSPSDYDEEKLKALTGNDYDGVGKVRMEEPERVWDYTRFQPAFFRHIERCIRALDEIGVQADLILFHPYDRWGYSRMPLEAQNHYLRYVADRFSAYPNVWWSMANEYDLLPKTSADWESNAAVLCARDPYRHLRSIHNCMKMYDHSRGWITHCSIQRIDYYRTTENTDLWREQYGKPVVLDEIAYEGNLPFGWGNISGQELTRRFWEAYVRGGYGQHGETYENPEDVLWWSHGGTLHGDSPARIRFLKGIMEENGGYMNPIPGDFDCAAGSNRGTGARQECMMFYYSFGRPGRRTYHYPGERFQVDVIDTWGMSVERLGVLEGKFTVALPAREYMAVRLTWC